MKARGIIAIVIALLVGTLALDCVHAARITSTSAGAIQGVPVCSGTTPSSGQLFQFFSGSACFSSTPTLNGTIKLVNGIGSVVVGNDGGNGLTATAGGNTLSIFPASSTTWSSNLNYTWNNNTDLTQANGTRATYGIFVPTLSGVAALHAWGNYRPTVNSHIRRFDAWADTPAVGCTTAAQIDLKVNGSQAGGTGVCTFANGTSATGSSFTTVAVPAGQTVQVDVFTAASGCTTFPQNINFTVELTTD